MRWIRCADDEADIAGAVPLDRQARDGIRDADAIIEESVLQLTAARIRCLAEHEDATFAVTQQRFERVMALERIGGDGVEAPLVEIAARIGRQRVRHIADLGVQEQWNMRRHVVAERHQCLKPRQPVRGIEAEVRLVAADQVGGRVHDGSIEGADAARGLPHLDRKTAGIGIESDAQERVVALLSSL
jgi:hypothetical protein